MRKLIILALILLPTVLNAEPVWTRAELEARREAHERLRLKGLVQIFPWVLVSESADQSPIDTASARVCLEGRLRQAGITVAPSRERPGPVGALTVAITLLGCSDDRFVVLTTFSLRAWCYSGWLPYYDDSTFSASVWSNWYVGTSSPKEINSVIREHLQSGMDAFINDYFISNPKK